MELVKIAQQVAQRLAQRQQRLVLAESCTGGLIAATLAAIPGISSHFCGSSVVYREQTKQQWLGVPASLLQQWSAVSTQASAAIAHGALERTSEATVSLGITGHLGPDASPELDGKVYLAIWRRQRQELREVTNSDQQLKTCERADRQREACELAFRLLLVSLEA